MGFFTYSSSPEKSSSNVLSNSSSSSKSDPDAENTTPFPLVSSTSSSLVTSVTVFSFAGFLFRWFPSYLPSITLRPGTGTSTSRQPTLWGSPTRSSSTGRPWATSRAQENTIPAMTSSPAQSKQRSASTPSRPHLRGYGVHLLTLRARNDGRPRRFHQVGVLPLHQANARLGPAGRRARGQAQEGHLFRASPGHDRPSDYSPRRRPARRRGRARPQRGGLGSLNSLLFFLPLRSCSDLLLVTMLIKLPLSLLPWAPCSR